jgi:hypothetical protein
LGIACEHIFAVLVYLNIVITLPKCLILKRWTKAANDSIQFFSPKKDISKEPTMIAQFASLIERCKRMYVAAVNCGKSNLMRSTIDIIAQTKVLEDACTEVNSDYVQNRTFYEETILNPSRVRTKGCGATTTSTPRKKGKGQGTTRRACTVCRVEGHNRMSCPVRLQIENGDVNLVDSYDMDADYVDTVS